MHKRQSASLARLPGTWAHFRTREPAWTGTPVKSRQRELYKRVFDAACSGLAIIALAPLLGALALAVKVTSPGPVLFRQARYGRDNSPFLVLKFRTMYVDRQDPLGTRQTRPNDPRVTPLGRVMRRLSLDELPQLFNVLRGEMSLVGPRAHVPGMRAGGMLYEELVPYYFARHRVRPGITGLAQVRGLRGSTEDREAAIARIEADLTYIENHSIGLDLRIIWLTFWRECLGGTGS